MNWQCRDQSQLARDRELSIFYRSIFICRGVPTWLYTRAQSPQFSVTRRQESLFNFWSFTTMKICPIAYTFFKILPNAKSILKQKPKTLLVAKDFKMFPKWRNFATTGHTGPHGHLSV